MTYDEEPAFQNDGELHQQLIADVLAACPEKSRKRRQKHLSVAKATETPAAEADGLLTNATSSLTSSPSPA
jgi:nitrogenase molybdenum-iron protein alpha chain